MILPITTYYDRDVYAAVCRCGSAGPLAFDVFIAQWNAEDAGWLTWPGPDGDDNHECPACLWASYEQAQAVPVNTGVPCSR